MMVATFVFVVLSLGSAALAQDEDGTTVGGEEAAEEADEGPSPVSGSEPDDPPTPEEVAGDVEPFDDVQEVNDFAAPIETAGSADDEWEDLDAWEEEEGDADVGSGGRSWDFHLGGFVEGLVAPRVVRSSASADEFAAAEARFRLNLDAVHEIASARFRGDVFFDGVLSRIWFDIRDASIFVRGGDWFSMRFGRQVLTWGTGDFLFLNDLFPKDFNSFFIGRADEYLKAPSTSIKTTFMIGRVGLDLVWTPIFESDRFIDGERLSFFNPLLGEIQGDRSPFSPLEPVFPERRLRNGTVHGRLYGSAGPVEMAAYGYVGFWPQPTALTGPPSPDVNLTFARLAVYGASLRTTLGGGLFNVEGAFYDSFDDRAGTNPEIPNSQLRGLVGYERELLPKFQMGLQYYLEYTLEYDALIANSFFPQYEQNEFRHVLTVRLTQLLVMDKLEISLFAFFSPDELDTYVRPRVTYKIIDPLALVVGANLMFGRDDFTFFGQLEENTNVYVRLRYSF